MRKLWAGIIARQARGPRLLVITACIAILGMFFLTSDPDPDPDRPRGDGHYRPILAHGDGNLNYLMARSTALDFDWNFDDDLARFGDQWNLPRTATGRKIMVQPIGPALVWTPLIWVAEGLAAIADGFGADIPLHGYTMWHQRFVLFSSALFACAAVLLGRRVARAAIGGSWSPSYAAVAILLGTPLTYYATIMPSYAHAMDAFACAGLLAYWIATIGRCDWKRWCVLGCLLGIAMLIRIQELGMGVVVAIEVAFQIVQSVRARNFAIAARWLGGGALVLAIALVCFIPQLYEWHIVFGSSTALPQGAHFTRPDAPMVAEMLFSSRNGWLSTHPIAYAGLIGLFMLPRRSRLIMIGLLAVVAIQIYLNSIILDWWSGASFGQRRMCNVTLPLVVGFAALTWRVGRLAVRLRRVPRIAWHVVCVLVLVMFAGWNVNEVKKLRHENTAQSEPVRTCCDNFDLFKRPARWVYDHIGNPFQFPASAIFGLRHHVPWSRFDQAVGSYPLMPGMGDLLSEDLYFAVRGQFRVGDPNAGPFLVTGWSRQIKYEQRDTRFTTAEQATVLIPVMVPEGQHFTLWLTGGGAREAVVEWNGEPVATATLDDHWTAVVFDRPGNELHTNELTIRSSPAPFTINGKPWKVGVGVSDLDIELIRP